LPGFDHVSISIGLCRVGGYLRFKNSPSPAKTQAPGKIPQRFKKVPKWDVAAAIGRPRRRARISEHEADSPEFSRCVAALEQRLLAKQKRAARAARFHSFPNFVTAARADIP
jgi:hypothetical protein